MSNSDLFRIDTGLEIDEASQVLTGAGAPGSTTLTDNAQRGSSYTDTNTGALYLKISSGSGTVRWTIIATEAYVQTYVSTSVSWHAPADVADTTSATTTALLVDLDADDLIQGVAVTVGMRILGTNVTGAKDIYVVGGATGAWTVTATLSPPTVGDTTYIDSGTNAGFTYQFNGTNWIRIGAADSTEIGYIQTFIGKTGNGSITPTYTTNNVVTTAQSLETAIGKLDTEAGYVATFLGKTLGNNLPSYTSTNWIANSTSVALSWAGPGAMPVITAISRLDAEIGANVTNGSKILAANTVNANITALDAEEGSIASFLGKTIGTATPAYSSYVYIGSASTAVQTALGALDAAIDLVAKKKVSNGITTVVDVDTIVGARLAEWDVRVELVSDSTKVESMKIFATHNGVVGDFTLFARLKLGGGIAALVVEGNLVGSDLVLQVSCASAVNVVCRRVTSFL
jgi:hypothetical protein